MALSDSGYYNSLPASVYWKDKNGVYLGRNLYAFKKMQALGLERCTNKDFVIGKTDYDFFSEEVAEQYRENDLMVLTNGEELVKEEVVRLPSGEIIIQLSSKAVFYNEKNQVAGVIGTTVDITSIRKHSSYTISVEFYQRHGLRKRQAECLYLLVRGMTLKQIGQELSLSPRTVEHYLEAVKSQFGCNSRSELIKFALSLCN